MGAPATWADGRAHPPGGRPDPSGVSRVGPPPGVWVAARMTRRGWILFIMCRGTRMNQARRFKSAVSPVTLRRATGFTTKRTKVTKEKFEIRISEFSFVIFAAFVVSYFSTHQVREETNQRCGTATGPVGLKCLNPRSEPEDAGDRKVSFRPWRRDAHL